MATQIRTRLGTSRLSRTHFLAKRNKKKLFLFAIGILLSTVASAQVKVDPISADKLGWQLAVHSYTFQKFSIFDAIDMTAALGVKYPTSPKTLGEHLRKKRIDMQPSTSQLDELLGLGVTDSAIEKWEKNQNRPTEPYRTQIMEFLGFDPETANPTGGS